jgi:anti-anti-sigma factor
VVDLRETTFLDLCALRVLLEADGALRAVGGRVVLCWRAGSNVARLLDLTGLGRRFERAGDRDGAVARARATRR